MAEVTAWLQDILDLLPANRKAYLEKEIADNLDNQSQQRLEEILKGLLLDEIAFLIEIEIRRKRVKRSSLYN